MITKEQWLTIHTDMLGLRSEDNSSQINSAASYAMDCGKNWSDPIPENWIELLYGTIKLMQGFPGYEKRYLLIVSKSHGPLTTEYHGCFPKCSAKATEIKAHISLDNNIDVLVNWVIEQF